mgnify:FL=1|jgi:hypothetical protein
MIVAGYKTRIRGKKRVSEIRPALLECISALACHLQQPLFYLQGAEDIPLPEVGVGVLGHDDDPLTLRDPTKDERSRLIGGIRVVGDPQVAAMGIFSCIVPGILTGVIQFLLALLNIAGGVILLGKRFLPMLHSAGDSAAEPTVLSSSSNGSWLP